VSELGDDQFNVLATAVAGPDAFARPIGRCTAISQKLNGKLSASEVFSVLGSLAFLYDRCREWEGLDRDGKEMLDQFLQLTGMQKDEGDRTLPRLLRLVGKNQAFQRRRKLRWLQTGILPTAVGFASFVDLRPRFEEDRSLVKEFVPMVIFRVMVESEYEQQPQVFQLNVEGIAKLRAVLDDIDKKLLAVKADSSFSERLLFDNPPSEEEEEVL